MGILRRHRLAASVALEVALCVALALTPSAPAVLFFALMAAFAVTGAVNTVRDAVVGWAVGAVALLAGTAWASPPRWFSDYLLTLAFGTTLWAAGVVVRRRTRHAQRMTTRAEQARAQGLAAVLEQRAQIARELHDVVSHGLAVVVLQAAAARADLADLSKTAQVGDVAGVADAQAPHRADLARRLETVEVTARLALDEMRRMLGVLRAGDLEGGPSLTATELEPDEQPSPGLADIDTLVDRAQAGGIRVLGCRVDPSLDVAPGLALAAYRIVQEGLTNALKHAAGAEVSVVVQERGGRLVVEVRDLGGAPGPLAADGAGLGLRGIRERAALYGGTVTLSGSGSGHVLRAELPCRARGPDAATSQPVREQVR